MRSIPIVPENPHAAAVSCRGCRYWSQMLAGNTGPRGEMQAVCLAPRSPHYQDDTGDSAACGEFAPGLAIDDPSRRVT